MKKRFEVQQHGTGPWSVHIAGAKKDALVATFHGRNSEIEARAYAARRNGAVSKWVDVIDMAIGELRKM